MKLKWQSEISEAAVMSSGSNSAQAAFANNHLFGALLARRQATPANKLPNSQY